MFRPLITFLIGTAILILGFLYFVVFAGIPYQDPPQYLLERYAFHTQVSNVIMLVGVVTALVITPLQVFFLKTKKHK